MSLTYLTTDELSSRIKYDPRSLHPQRRQRELRRSARRAGTLPDSGGLARASGSRSAVPGPGAGFHPTGRCVPQGGSGKPGAGCGRHHCRCEGCFRGLVLSPLRFRAPPRTAGSTAPAGQGLRGADGVVALVVSRRLLGDRPNAVRLTADGWASSLTHSVSTCATHEPLAPWGRPRKRDEAEY